MAKHIKSKRVFLGGTCADSTWRGQMIIHLQEQGLDWFDPVVEDWNEEAQENERRERAECDFCLYTITPKMTGVYAIAEVVEDSMKRPAKTVFVVLREDNREHFTESQWKSLMQVARMVLRNGGLFSTSLKLAAEIIGERGAVPT